MPVIDGLPGDVTTTLAWSVVACALVEALSDRISHGRQQSATATGVGLTKPNRSRLLRVDAPQLVTADGKVLEVEKPAVATASVTPPVLIKARSEACASAQNPPLRFLGSEPSAVFLEKRP